MRISPRLAAALFAVWMIFFPQYIPAHFAWTVTPRMTQLFIGAGYIFRTYFFALFIFEKDWRKLRWAFVGNMVFTGALMLATLWHADEMHWRTVVGHLWIILYTAEPVTMFLLIPRGETARLAHTTTGGPILPWFRRFLMLEVGITALLGAFLIINPEFFNTRWPWNLNPFDARIMAAWFVGWACWAGAIVLAEDWDEVRLAAIGNIIFGLALTAVNLIFYSQFDHTKPNVNGYVIWIIILTLGMAFFYWQQERRRARA